MMMRAGHSPMRAEGVSAVRNGSDSMRYSALWRPVFA